MNDYLVLPSMGEGIQEATLVKWLKAVGSPIHKGEPIVQVSTDKVDTDVWAVQSGFLLATFCEEGALVKVGQPMAQVSASLEVPVMQPASSTGPDSSSLAHVSGQALSQAKSQASSQAGKGPLFHKEVLYSGLVRASPVARKLAQAHHLPLGRVPGSAFHGRITREDVERFVAREGLSHGILSEKKSEFQGLKTELKGGLEHLEGVPVRREPMSKIRRLTADHMLHSVRTSPHVTTTFEMDMENLKTLKGCYTSQGVRLTYTAFFLRACALALPQHPALYGAVDGYDILYREDINLGCAVAMDTGLIVPVIKGAQNLSLEAIGQTLHELVQRAREKRLKADDVTGGTFSVTNPGLYGSLHSQPIIHQPQVAILSIGAMVERPVVHQGQIVVRTVCQVGLTFDHRLVDGEGGAKFLTTLKGYLEDPKRL
jgi:2-oxoglutarate dehydrogenase E2 component (dihydrolipoamide succinyltransferase)